jgi:Tfp pilus assembly protein PilW
MTFKKYKFTILELMVAMSVFAVLMTVLMQFFSSAQKITINTKKKTGCYESSRLVFEMISRDLRTAKYIKVADVGSEKINFGPNGDITPSYDTNINKLSFLCYSPFNDDPTELTFAKYELSGTDLNYSIGTFDDTGNLTMGTISTIAEDVKSFEIESSEGDEFMPEAVTITMEFQPDSNNSDNKVTYTRTLYIGNRGQVAP